MGLAGKAGPGREIAERDLAPSQLFAAEGDALLAYMLAYRASIVLPKGTSQVRGVHAGLARERLQPPHSGSVMADGLTDALQPPGRGPSSPGGARSTTGGFH